MDAVEFHCEPPSNIPTMVVAFGGWIDAGEAVTGARACSHLSGQVSSRARCEVAIRFNMFHRPAL